jgi:hypothetical protein
LRSGNAIAKSESFYPYLYISHLPSVHTPHNNEIQISELQLSFGMNRSKPSESN